MASEDTQFKKGGAPGPGRPKGARNKLGEAFLEALCVDFEAHGRKTIETVRVENPTAYVKVCASILPKELSVKVDPLDDMTDEQLNDYIRRLAAVIGLEVGAGESAEQDPGAARH